jgi:uncharacterized membrane protein YhaH (DUF805 family)
MTRGNNDMNWQHLLLGFSGRTPRRDFWIGILGLTAAALFLGVIPVVGTVASFALLVPAAALTTKRLHDFGRSGWFGLVPLIPALLAGIIARLASGAMHDPATVGAAVAAAGLAAVLAFLAMAISLAFLAWVGTRQGDVASNRFGEPVRPVAAAL